MNNISSTEIEPPFFAGIDVGGTNIKIGILDRHGNRLGFTSFPTQDHLGPKDAIDRMCTALRALSAQDSINFDSINGIGLGTPGTMDAKRGLILEPPNLPGWRNFEIQRCLSQKADRPVTYVNDANAAAYGEFWIGGARESNVLTLFTLGTGVGGGIVIENELIVGASGNAAELGHVSIDFTDNARVCSCGIPGHLEAYASATAVALRARTLADENPGSELNALAIDGGDLTAKDVSIAAGRGDSVAHQLIIETAEYLARGIACVAHTLDPDSILLGGAMDFGGADSELGQEFLAAIRERVWPRCMSNTRETMRIEFALLGSDAGWIGAAGLAKHRYDLVHSPA